MKPTVAAFSLAFAAISHAGATKNGLPIDAHEADLRTCQVTDKYDFVASIGLLGLLDCDTATRVLEMLHDSPRLGGAAIVNTLSASTTWIGMFQAADCYQLAHNEPSRKCSV